jgi:hypothetical protein
VSGFDVATVDELDVVRLFDGIVWRPVRSRFDIRAFGVNAYEAEAVGQHVIEAHDETGGGAGGHEELYVVLRGRATFTIDGKVVDAPAGTLLFIRDPTLRREALAAEAGTLVLAVGGEPGQAFEVSPWETTFAALPDLRAGRLDAAIAKLERGLEEHPDHPSILYSLACAEALAGQAEAAIAHLDAAIERDASYRERARTDPDFDALRDLPHFPAAR